MGYEIPENAQKFLTLYKEAKDKRNLKAQYELANYYAGSKDETLRKKAYPLYKKAAEKGYTEAVFGLGVCYEFGIGIKQDFLKAMLQYRRVDISVTNDIMTNPDPIGEAESRRLQEIMADEEAYAEFEAYLNENVRETDVLETDIALAETGDRKAMHRMGCRYLDGKGVDKDEEKALELLKQSAEQGCDEAIMKLVDYYRLKHDLKKATRWYRQYAAERIKWRNRRLGW